MNANEPAYKCVTLIGELSDWGKHILMPFGCTLCGMPTVDAKKEQFPALNDKVFSDMISEYKEEKEWDITCEKCLEVFNIIKTGEEKRKAKKN